jgi:large subunit ribosomal protein L22
MLVKSTARSRYVSIPPRKMRLVADQVRGMPVEKALGVLHFSPRVAARHIAKTIKSAAANALSLEGTDNLKPEDLVVRSITVDDAPTAKRIRFQSMGRVYRIRKRYCHLTVNVEAEVEQEVKKARPRKTKSRETEPDKGKEKPKDKSTTKSRAKTKTKTKTKAKTTTKSKAAPKTDSDKTKKSAKPKTAKTAARKPATKTTKTGKATAKTGKRAASGDDK